MKKVYVMCADHMDPLWRRGYEAEAIYQDGIVKPYMDIEEGLIDGWLKILMTENSELIYGIEQSLTFKKYFERNPDLRDTIKALIRDGRIELLGGGETIIDSNMCDGESIVRNHMYSIKWFQDNMGKRPSHAICRDTFGMSAQLPQIFKKLGYNVMTGFAYAGRNTKPFWKGIDGSLIYFFQNYEGELPLTYLNQYHKIPTCFNCLGKGCIVCDFTGLDQSISRWNAFEDRVQKALDDFSTTDAPFILFIAGTEELAQVPHFEKRMKEMVKEHNYELEFTGDLEMVKRIQGEYVDCLSPNESLVDPRTDWNPACTGVYSSRIEVKKIVRKLENLLLSAEKFSVFAEQFGMIYPQKKLEGLWNKMSIMLFHDSITSTHGDKAYDELMSITRGIAQSGAKIYNQAMDAIARNIDILPREGMIPIILFNPLGQEVNTMPVKAKLLFSNPNSIKNITTSDVKVFDFSDNILTIINVETCENRFDTSLTIEFKCNKLPPVGYAVHYVSIPEEFKKIESGYKYNAIVTKEKSFIQSNAIAQPVISQQVIQILQSEKAIIENEYYKIKIKGSIITEIFDKKINAVVLQEGANSLTIEDDIGSPWETLVYPMAIADLTDDAYFLCEVLPLDWGISQRIEQLNGYTMFVREGHYCNPPRRIKKIVWRQEIILYAGVDSVFFKTIVDWDTGNTRIRVNFPMPFKTEDDTALYEIPFGLIERNAYKPHYEGYTCYNGDWPAINYVACFNKEENFTVAVVNKGTPSYIVKDGVMKISILRSPEEFFCGFDLENARDRGEHVFEYQLISGKGTVKDIDATGRAKEFNITDSIWSKQCEKSTELSSEISTKLSAKLLSKLPSVYSFVTNLNDANVKLAAIKRAEDGSGMILRYYEPYGDSAIDKVKINGDEVESCECDLLENQTGEVVKELYYKPFEIKTILVKK